MKLTLSSKFKKQVARLTKKDQALENRIHKQLKLFRSNQSHPSLRLHKLSGEDLWLISIDRSLRVILELKYDEATLLAIGKHEEVYN